MVSGIVSDARPIVDLNGPQSVANTIVNGTSLGSTGWSTTNGSQLRGGYYFNADYSTGSISQAAVPGLNLGAGAYGASQLSFGFGWNNGNPDVKSATVNVTVGGVVYARDRHRYAQRRADPAKNGNAWPTRPTTTPQSGIAIATAQGFTDANWQRACTSSSTCQPALAAKVCTHRPSTSGKITRPAIDHDASSTNVRTTKSGSGATLDGTYTVVVHRVRRAAAVATADLESFSVFDGEESRRRPSATAIGLTRASSDGDHGRARQRRRGVLRRTNRNDSLTYTATPDFRCRASRSRRRASI